jgi:hypothetical protein
MSAAARQSYTAIHKQTALELYQTFQYKKIERSASVEAELKEWREWFQNVRLVYMDSYYSSSGTGSVGGGYSSEERIDLCAAGYFNFSSSSDVSVSSTGASGYGYGNDQGQGKWEVITRRNTFILVLKYANGEVSEYDLKYEDSKLYLNGYRYYRITEGEERPDCY